MKEYRIDYNKPYFIVRKFRKFLWLFPSWKLVYYTTDFGEAQRIYDQLKRAVNVTIIEFDFDALYYEETSKLEKIRPSKEIRTFIKKRK